jgi:hypothetical protein
MLHCAIHTIVMRKTRNLWATKRLIIGRLTDLSPMRASIALAFIFIFAAAFAAQPALAKLTPFEQPMIAVTSFDDATVNTGPSGAMLESSYFNAPQPSTASIRVFPCRAQVNLFQKARLVRACD